MFSGSRAEPGEPQTVEHDEHRRERHCRSSNDRGEQTQGGDGDGEDVVAECPPQVAPDDPTGGIGELQGIHPGTQIGTGEGDVRCSDGDIGTGPHGHAQVCRGQGSRVVDAVTDEGHPTPLVTQLLDDRHLLARGGLRMDLVDTDGLGRCVGSTGVVTGEQHGP